MLHIAAIESSNRDLSAGYMIPTQLYQIQGGGFHISTLEKAPGIFYI